MTFTSAWAVIYYSVTASLSGWHHSLHLLLSCVNTPFLPDTVLRYHSVPWWHWEWNVNDVILWTLMSQFHCFVAAGFSTRRLNCLSIVFLLSSIQMYYLIFTSKAMQVIASSSGLWCHSVLMLLGYFSVMVVWFYFFLFIFFERRYMENFVPAWFDWFWGKFNFGYHSWQLLL